MATRTILKLTALLLSIPLFLAAAVPSGIQPSPRVKGKVEVEVKGPLSPALAAVEVHLGRSVIRAFEGERTAEVRASGVEPIEALRLLARAARLELDESGSVLLLRDRAEPALTIDVRDAPLAEILAAVKSQCGIRNIVVDPGVDGRGTFLFHEVPCGVALRTILGSLGLGAQIDQGSLLHVRREGAR
jgi:hypothetical protein